MTPGQKAYEAFGTSLRGWEDLDALNRQGWENAAAAVLKDIDLPDYGNTPKTFLVELEDDRQDEVEAVSFYEKDNFIYFSGVLAADICAAYRSTFIRRIERIDHTK